MTTGYPNKPLADPIRQFESTVFPMMQSIFSPKESDMTEPHARAVAAIDAYLAAHADQGEHGISGREIASIVLASIRTAEEEVDRLTAENARLRAALAVIEVIEPDSDGLVWIRVKSVHGKHGAVSTMMQTTTGSQRVCAAAFLEWSDQRRAALTDTGGRMTQTPPDLDKLRALAEAATQGEWEAQRDPCHYDSLSTVVAGDNLPKNGIMREMMVQVGGHAGLDEQQANTAYIAAAQPSAVMWMIERIRELEGWRVRIEQRDGHGAVEMSAKTRIDKAIGLGGWCDKCRIRTTGHVLTT